MWIFYIRMKPEVPPLVTFFNPWKFFWIIYEILRTQKEFTVSWNIKTEFRKHKIFIIHVQRQSHIQRQTLFLPRNLKSDSQLYFSPPRITRGANLAIMRPKKRAAFGEKREKQWIFMRAWSPSLFTTAARGFKSRTILYVLKKKVIRLRRGFVRGLEELFSFIFEINFGFHFLI